MKHNYYISLIGNHFHYFLFFLPIIFHLSTVAQPKWAWMSGSDTINQKGNYFDNDPGKRMPGARYRATTWTSKSSDTLWLFGGDGFGSISDLHGALNDLWLYRVSTGQWIHKTGSNDINANGNYNDANWDKRTPGAREGAVGWCDAYGNLWLFGGRGYDAQGTYGFLNDLWKYAVTDNRWTLIKGSPYCNQVGIYQNNDPNQLMPGARIGAMSWTTKDASGTTFLWLFGGNNRTVAAGNGDAPPPDHHFNDVWKYNSSTGYWTWEGGSSNQDQRGHYGVMEAFRPDNMPGARSEANIWQDTQHETIYMYGGYGYDDENRTGTASYLADLWQYKPGQGWTWINGSKLKDFQPNYSDADPSKVTPGYRMSATTWIGSDGSLWLMNGVEYRNDLWEYNISEKRWNWMAGTQAYLNTHGAYTATPQGNGCYPGGRFRTAAWTNNNKTTFWMFGGYGYPKSGVEMKLNDLWKLTLPGQVLPVQFISFTAKWESQNAVRLDWVTQESNTERYEIEFSKDGHLFQAIGKMQSKGSGVNGMYFYSFIHARSASGNSYYRIKQIDNDGTFAYSNVIAISNKSSKEQNLNVYPVPVFHTVYIQVPDLQKPALLNVYNGDGKLLLQEKVGIGEGLHKLYFSSLPKGVYYIEAKQEGGRSYVQKVTKQ